MRERPIVHLADALASLGVRIDIEGQDGCPPVRTAGGGVPGGPGLIDGRQSSQYTSAVLLAAPYAEREDLTDDYTPEVLEELDAAYDAALHASTEALIHLYEEANQGTLTAAEATQMIETNDRNHNGAVTEEEFQVSEAERMMPDEPCGCDDLDPASMEWEQCEKGCLCGSLDQEGCAITPMCHGFWHAERRRMAASTAASSASASLTTRPCARWSRTSANSTTCAPLKASGDPPAACRNRRPGETVLLPLVPVCRLSHALFWGGVQVPKWGQ